MRYSSHFWVPLLLGSLLALLALSSPVHGQMTINHPPITLTNKHPLLLSGPGLSLALARNGGRIQIFARSMNPYMPANPYLASYGYMPPYSSYAGGGYGGGSYGVPMMYPQPQPSSSYSSSSAPPAHMAKPENAHLDWPLGLRVLPPAEESKALRQDVEALLQKAAGQEASGAVDPQLLQSASRDVQRLRRLLEDSETKLARATVTEAQQFLEKLDEVVKPKQ